MILSQRIRYKERKTPPTAITAAVRPLMAALPAPLVGAVRGADVEGVTTPVPDECGAVPVADKVLLWIG